MPITLTADWGEYPEGTTFSVIGELPEGRDFVDQVRAAQLITDRLAVEGAHGADAKPKPKKVKRG